MTSWILILLTFLPFLAAIIAYMLGRRDERAMNGFVSITGIVIFALSVVLLFLPEGEVAVPGFCGLGLYLRADGFRGLYSCVAAFMWMMTGLFAPEYFQHHGNKARYSFFTLMTLGATLGVFLSDNLGTTFLFFEIMSFASYAWVAQEETPGALRAAATYLAVAVIGGLTTLMGLFLLQHQLGTLDFASLRAAMGQQDVTVAVWLTLVGFGAKAGLFPLHIWLPKAHPVAPAPASALLSGILTKSGVFGLIVLCANLMQGNAAFGNALMIFAAITMFLGALLALFSTDLKRTLACSSMSQIGFITLGLSVMVLLGDEGTLAAYGSVMHMLNHSLIKLTLFTAAGVVYMNLHALNLDDIRGFGRKKPLLHIAFLLGALSIACIPPLGSGYNSKSLLHEGLLELIGEMQAAGSAWMGYKAIEVLFLISGGLTVAYMAKLYICIFWQKHPSGGIRRHDALHERHNRVCAAGQCGGAPLSGHTAGAAAHAVRGKKRGVLRRTRAEGSNCVLLGGESAGRGDFHHHRRGGVSADCPAAPNAQGRKRRAPIRQSLEREARLGERCLPSAAADAAAAGADTGVPLHCGAAGKPRDGKPRDHLPDAQDAQARASRQPLHLHAGARAECTGAAA